MSAAVRLLVGIALVIVAEVFYIVIDIIIFIVIILVIVAEVFYYECNFTCTKNMHFQVSTEGNQ